MNIRTGLKTLAVALPMACAPIKSSAQTVVKQVEKTASADAMKFNGGFGFGAGLDPFFNQAYIEPKIVGNLNFHTYNMNGSLTAHVGKAVQTADLRIAHPIKLDNPVLSIDVGGHARYQHINKKSDVSPVVLKKDLGESNIPLYQGSTSIGLYIEPKYKVLDKLNITTRAEFGGYNLKEVETVTDRTYVLSENVKQGAKETGVVGNIEVGAEYNVVKNFAVDANVGYSTLHKTPSFMVNSKFKF